MNEKGFAVIDLDNLELEWLDQDQKVQKVAKQLAHAKFDLAELEAEQEVVEARLKLKLRNRPKKYGLKSTANEPVKERMLLFPNYQELTRRINKAKQLVDLLNGAMKVLDNRRDALKDLVTLQGRSYFATPRMDDSVPRIVKQRIESEEIRKSVTKKRKKS